MNHLKKVLPSIEAAIVILLTKGFFMDKGANIPDCIIALLNTYYINKLIDVFSIIIYLLPLITWTTIILFSINTYYENFNFLVPRLGGVIPFNRTLLLKIIKDTAILILNTYVILILFLMITRHSLKGNFYLILLSAILNYSIVTMVCMLFLILRIYHKFSLAFTITYFVKISLFTIGLFLKYIDSSMILIKNPLMNTIVILKGQYGVLHYSHYIKILAVHLLIIIILYSVSEYILRKRRRLND